MPPYRNIINEIIKRCKIRQRRSNAYLLSCVKPVFCDLDNGTCFGRRENFNVKGSGLEASRGGDWSGHLKSSSIMATQN